MKNPTIVIIILLLVCMGCSPTPQQENPQWVDDFIDQFQDEPVGNPPQSIWRYEYQGQTVYFIPAQCCDQYSALYDAEGNELCAPDGGIDGKGDGKCPDFFEERTDELLVWEDARTP